MRFLSLAIVLFVFWLVLSGLYKTHLLILGVLSCLFCVFLAGRMGVVDKEGHPIQLLLRAPIYMAWLVVEIFKSAVNVTWIVLRPDLPISPRVITVQASQKSPLGVQIYANSITLTPGTVTVLAQGNSLTVHALTEDGAEGLREGLMDRQVSQFEGEA